MKLRTGLVALLLLVGIGQMAEAQLTQIRRDYRQPMTYSPDDPFTKGVVYRLQTGQAGKYFNCDCEEEKRYSPYIYWQTVCNHTHPKPYCTVLLRDLHEVKERVRAGACRGGENCDCNQCQQRASGNHYLAQKSVEPVTRPLARDVSPVAPDASTATKPDTNSEHLVYGSRATRQRVAQQASFSEPVTRTAATKSNDQPTTRTRR